MPMRIGRGQRLRLHRDAAGVREPHGLRAGASPPTAR
jgi:hypothetical protein